MTAGGGPPRLPVRVAIHCDEHDSPEHVVTFEDRAARDAYEATGDDHHGEWFAVEYGGGYGEGMSGSVATSRGKRSWVCGLHAPRNRKPIQFSSAPSEVETVNLLAYAGLATVTLVEVRAFRAALAALKRQRATTLEDVARVGNALVSAREVT